MAMNKEKVQKYLRRMFFPRYSATKEERQVMLNYVIVDFMLPLDEELYEDARERRWREFNSILDELLDEYNEGVFQYRRKGFVEHYDNPLCSPMLRWNEKYLTPELEDYTPIIAIQDLMDRKYVVCAISSEKTGMWLMQMERTPVVVAQYNSLDAMVRDGWSVGS